MLRLIEKYRLDLEKKKICYDKDQEFVVKELDILIDIIINNNKKKYMFFFSDILNFFKKNHFCGIYLWGGIGRGKTYLVDLFYFELLIEKKIRLHYHHFISIVRSKLNEYFGRKDPLKLVADFFVKNYFVICLDEFFVKDIVDAMTLSKLFYYLFNNNIFFVITSNIFPSNLYKDGLQRQKFLQAIYLIEKHLKIINISGNTDFRLKNLVSEQMFFFTLGYKTCKNMIILFLRLSKTNLKKKKFIIILGRKISTICISETIVWFDFKVICGTSRSQLDYIEIASVFNIIFISGIQKMSSQMDDIARRFIFLIDEFYDKKIKIIMSLECCIDDLYYGDLLKFDFNRTISRLKEMSTINYLKDSIKYVF